MSETPISSLDLISKAQIDPANDIIGLVDKSDTAMSVNGSNKKATIESLVKSVLDDFSWGDIGGDISDQTDLSLVLAALDAAKLDKTGGTVTGQLINALGTIAANTPLSLTQTWNNAAVVFTGLNLDITDTASNSGSLLLNLKTGGSSKASVDKAGVLRTTTLKIPGNLSGNAVGTATVPAIQLGGPEPTSTNGFFAENTGLGLAICTTLNGVVTRTFSGTYGFQLQAGVPLRWADDLFLYRDSGSTLAQRNGTNAQNLRLYGTYTDSSNYRRFYINSTTGGAFTIGVTGAGTGASGNSLSFCATGGILSRNADNSANAPVICSEIDFGWNLGFARKITPQNYGVLIPANSTLEGTFTTGNNRLTLNPGISLSFNTTDVDVSLHRNTAGQLDVRGNSGLRVRNFGNTAFAKLFIGDALQSDAPAGEINYLRFFVNGSLRGDFFVDSAGSIGYTFNSGGPHHFVLRSQNGGDATNTAFAFQGNTALWTEGYNVLAQRNGTNAQNLRLYGTYTDSSNYRRLYINSTTGGAFTIGVTGAGTGASGNTLSIANSVTLAAGTSLWFTPASGNTPRFYVDGYALRGFGDDIWLQANYTLLLNSYSNVSIEASDALKLQATNSVKVRCNNGLSIRNNADSADATLTAGAITASGAVTANGELWANNTINFGSVTAGNARINMTSQHYTPANLAINMPWGSGNQSGIYGSNGLVGFSSVGVSFFEVNSSGLRLAGTRSIGLGGTIASPEVLVLSGGANVLEQRNGTNAQRLNLYGTYTDASNYRRLYLSSTTAGAFTLGVEGLGTGASGNTLTINNYTSFNNGIGITGALSVNQYDTVSDTQVSVELRNGANRATVNTGIAFRPGPTAHYVAYINGVTNSTWNSLVDSSLRFFVAKNNNSTTVSLSHLHQAMSLTAARLNITPEAVTSGSPTGFLFVGPAYTTLDAGIEATDVNWNLARSVQFSTGAITTQRAFRIQAPTYAFAGASTITNASTLAISGAPIAGTNATITNAFALNVENGALGVGIAGVDYGRIIIQDSGQLSSNNAIRVHAGGIYLGQNISVFTVLHNGDVYVRGTLNTDALGGGIVTRIMSFDGGWGSLTRAVTTPQGNGNRFTNIYGLQIACGNNYGLMVTGSGSNIQLYNTFTDTNNYIRQALSFTTYSSTVHAQHVVEGLGTGAVNIPLVLTPRGTGAFIVGPMPDGTSTGGNARGANAIDLQTSRSSAAQVASGAGSIAIGTSCQASAVNCIAIGRASATGGSSLAIGTDGATANGAGSVAIGFSGITASGASAIAIGPSGATATANCSIALGSGTASRENELAWGFRHTAFDVRPGAFLLSALTTNSTATALQLRNVFGSSNFTTRSNTVLHGTLHVTGVKSDGAQVAVFTRRIVIKNVGGVITLVQSQTIGTDYEDNSATDLTISSTSPFFEVTGITGETWRWVGWFSPTCEIAYGT